MEPNIFAIYKPKGISSNAALNRLRRFFGTKRIGHAGTLDPLAEGVLVVGIGREATRKLAEVVKKEKEYIATVRLGETSTTDDEEGEKRQVAGNEWLIANKPTEERVKNTLKDFVGMIEQVPPRYSALKVQGRRAYRMARGGEDFELKPRPAEIKSIEILSYKWPDIQIRVVTGPGVYIRALARDMGAKLGTGAYLSHLRRTRVGDFLEYDAMSLDKF